MLSVTAFNGATKRHKPNLNIGAAVLCYVTSADPQLDIELSCEDKSTQKDWSSMENLFGSLPAGFPMLITDISLPYASHLQRADTSGIIKSLAKNFKFEMAVGKNGRLYILAETRREVIAITKAFQHAERLTDIQAEALAKLIKQNLDL